MCKSAVTGGRRVATSAPDTYKCTDLMSAPNERSLQAAIATTARRHCTGDPCERSVRDDPAVPPVVRVRLGVVIADLLALDGVGVDLHLTAVVLRRGVGW